MASMHSHAASLQLDIDVDMHASRERLKATFMLPFDNLTFDTPHAPSQSGLFH